MSITHRTMNKTNVLRSGRGGQAHEPLDAEKRNGTTRSREHPAGPSASLDVRSQLAAIVESSSDAIFSRTFDGVITTWNGAAQRMFGYTSREIIGASSRMLFPPGRHEEFSDLAERIRAGSAVQHFETDRIRKNGSSIRVSLALSPIRDTVGKLVGISTIARDISEQERMREALVERERELADLFEEASVGLIWVSPQGVVLRANRAFLRLLKCKLKQCIGRPLRHFQPDETCVEDLLVQLANRGTIRNFPAEFLAATGEARPVLIDANAFWRDGRLVHSRWFVRDISQRKRLERELLELSDRERRTFAQELHDGLGQQLGGVAYLANVLHERLMEGGASSQADEAARICSLVRDAVEQTRRLARGLSPIREEPEGLSHALEELAMQTREVFKVTCQFHCRKPVQVVETAIAGHLYRIAQEAVNNALKHSGAHKIGIRLSRRARQLVLTIRDDGKGIGVLSPLRRGLGLRIMQYRSELMRGRLRIGPRRDGTGTEVSCIAPCPARINSK